MVTLVQSTGYTGPERRRRQHISDSQFGEIVEKVSDSDRIRRIDDRIDAINGQLRRGSERMDDIAGSVADTRAQVDLTAQEMSALSVVTQRVAGDTHEIRELLETGRALFRFASGFGRLVRWIGGLAGAGAAIWALIYAATHGGKPPG